MPEDPAYAEIRALRERLAHLEEVARATPPASPFDDAIGDAMGRPPVDRKARDLQNAAHFYDPTAEDAFRERERVGAEKYDADLKAMGGDLLAQSIALAGREAHVKLGRALPTPVED